MMPEIDRRCLMSCAEFDAIPDDDEYPIDPYYEALIDRNKQIGHEVYEQPERFQELTTGQQILIQLGTFDSQVKNGGITQFFWNCPGSIFDIADWLVSLGLPGLQTNYERALEALVGKKDRWLALRQQWADAGETPKWESFQESYRVLDLGWFDDSYFDKHGYNERHEWVRKSRGLHYVLQKQLVAYICENRFEFITEY